MSNLSKRQRLESTIAGEAVDRPAVALWRHWPGDDQRAEDLARATLDFQNMFDYDFIKVTPSSSYCIADWGAETQWVGHFHGTRQYGQRVIQQLEDWACLRVLDPYHGLLDEVRRSLVFIGQEVGEEVPFIQTIFNPLCQAKYLAGERLTSDLRQHPDTLKMGLDIITETSIRFIEAIRETGIAGIFLALQHASYDLLTEAEYLEFGLPYDLRVLEAAEGLWLNLIHLHGNNVMFDTVAGYPAQAINWHDQETPPSLSDAAGLFSGALVGGIRQEDTIARGTPDQVRSEIKAAVDQTGGRRLIVGTGCVTPIIAPVGNLRAAREAVESL